MLRVRVVCHTLTTPSVHADAKVWGRAAPPAARVRVRARVRERVS